MNLTENTKVRIKVPKHLYESIQEELGKMEEKKHENSMEEAISGKAEELKDFYEKVKEQVDGGTDLDSAVTFVMNDLGMEMMEEGEEIKEYVGMSPDQMQIVDILGQLIAGGALGGAVLMAAKTLYSFLKNKKSAKVSTEESAIEEIEEAFDFETLMEAMKDASKKKAEDKKKMTEANKKKVEDEKKKKEAEAKKKAAAVKKK